MPSSHAARAQIDEKSNKNQRKSTPDRPKIDEKSILSRFERPSRFGDASGRPQDGFWTPKCRPKAHLGAPRASQERPGAVQKPRRAPQRRSKTLPMCCPSACGAPSGFERVCGSIFGWFCRVAQNLRCASRISFYSVLLGSNKISSKRVHAAENVGIRSISVSQSESGSVWATQNRAWAAQFEQQNAKKTHEVKRFFLWGAERLQLKRGSALRRR